VLVVRTWPVISLSLVPAGVVARHGDALSYINGVRQEGAHWYTDQNDEVFVEPGSCTVQLGLFNLCEEARPYTFQPGVDYSRWAWKCERCGQDFNATPEKRYFPAFHCNRPATQIILMEPRPVPPARAESEYVRVLNRFAPSVAKP